MLDCPLFFFNLGGDLNECKITGNPKSLGSVCNCPGITESGRIFSSSQDDTGYASSKNYEWGVKSPEQEAKDQKDAAVEAARKSEALKEGALRTKGLSSKEEFEKELQGSLVTWNAETKSGILRHYGMDGYSDESVINGVPQGDYEPTVWTYNEAYHTGKSRIYQP